MATLEATREKDLGDSAYRRGDFPRALGHYEAALSWSPRDLGSWDSLSTILLDTKAYREVGAPPAPAPSVVCLDQ